LTQNQTRLKAHYYYHGEEGGKNGRGEEFITTSRGRMVSRGLRIGNARTEEKEGLWGFRRAGSRVSREKDEGC